VFLTLAYASMNLQTRRMVYFRAGHNSCLVRRANGRVERLMPPGMIIGFDPGPRFNAGLGSAVCDLAPGDCVLLYTDGASEAMNSRSEEFGENRLSDALAGCSGSAAEVLRAAEAAVVAFCDGERQRDDLTLLVLKITG
jgi:sigma-B regulation protein RsbU (phosphoserine phosphatase)